jgi:hypothetical protein
MFAPSEVLRWHALSVMRRRPRSRSGGREIRAVIPLMASGVGFATSANWQMKKNFFKIRSSDPSKY